MEEKEAAEEFLKILDAHGAATEDVLEGDQDLGRMTTKEGEQNLQLAANADEQRVDRRNTLMSNARKAVKALLNDGFPNDPPLTEVDPQVYDALQAQERTLKAALARFKPRGAAAKGTIEGLDTGKPRP